MRYINFKQIFQNKYKKIKKIIKKQMYLINIYMNNEKPLKKFKNVKL